MIRDHGVGSFEATVSHGCVSTDQSLGDVNWIFFFFSEQTCKNINTDRSTPWKCGLNKTTLALAVTVIPFRKAEQDMRDHKNILDSMKKDAVRKHEQILDLVAANMLNKGKKDGRCFNWDDFSSKHAMIFVD